MAAELNVAACRLRGAHWVESLGLVVAREGWGAMEVVKEVWLEGAEVPAIIMDREGTG